MKHRMIRQFFPAMLCLLGLTLCSTLFAADDVRLVTVRKGDTASYLSFRIYGMYNLRILDVLKKENPGVSNFNMIHAGQELRFPTPAAMKTLLGDKKPQLQEPKEQPQSKEPAKAEDLPHVKATANKAVITYLEGQVQVRKSTSAAWSSAAPNQILYALDEIRVPAKSRAELILDNQSVMRLSENTHLALKQLDVEPASKKEMTSVGLSLGKLWTKAGKVFNRSSRLEVRTPTAIAGVQGTVYAVNVENERATQIQVYDGAVAVTNPVAPSGPRPEGAKPLLAAPQKIEGPKPVSGPVAVSREEWTEIILRKAQQMTVTDQGVPQPVSFDIERERRNEWVRWNEARDAEFLPPQRPQ